MKILGVFLLAIFLSFNAKDVEQVKSNHIEDNLGGLCVKEEKFGDNCGNKNSYLIRISNCSSSTRDAKYCLKKSNGKWTCWANHNWKPSATTTAYVCSRGSTTRLLYFTRAAGDWNHKFPTEKEVNEKY